MRYEIVFDPKAVEDIRRLRSDVLAEVRDAIETYLRHEPTKISKSRIKRLRDLSHPQYRLKLGDVCVFYDVLDSVVEILAIAPKSEGEAWLQQEGDTDERSDDR